MAMVVTTTKHNSYLEVPTPPLNTSVPHVVSLPTSRQKLEPVRESKKT